MELPGPFRLAAKASYQSDYKVKVGAALVIGKSVITGRNIVKTHPIYGYSVHAETNCLTHCRKYDIIGSMMYIYRESRGKPALARPCEKCMEILRKAKIKEIIYTIDKYPFYRKEVLQ